MIFAKIDVSFPRHHRLLHVRPECACPARRVRVDDDPGVRSDADGAVPSDDRAAGGDRCARMARAAALGIWTAALCYTRDQMLDGFCPLIAIEQFAVAEVIDELVQEGLFVRAERDGRPGVVIVNYAKHNETRADVDARMNKDRTRKRAERREGAVRSDKGHGVRVDRSIACARIPRSESESQSESDPEPDRGKGLPSQAPARRGPRSETERAGEHQALIAHYAAEFERLKGAKPVIGAKGGAGAKKLLEGRTLAEAKAIVDRALSDPWMLENSPDLAAIAGKINAFIGRRGVHGSMPRVTVQPACGSWKKAEIPQ